VVPSTGDKKAVFYPVSIFTTSISSAMSRSVAPLRRKQRVTNFDQLLGLVEEFELGCKTYTLVSSMLRVV